jgi:hypothetical protein
VFLSSEGFTTNIVPFTHMTLMRSPFFSILRLESEFPRPMGDSANPKTHAFPVRVAIVRGATVDRVVYQAEGSKRVVANFIKVAKDQIEQGAIAVGTSCGFLFEHQDAIQREISVPFVSSSLTELVQRQKVTNANRQIGVLTFDDEVLTSAHWFQQATQTVEQMIVQGLPKQGYLYDVIRNNRAELDLATATIEVVNVALDLLAACVEKYGIGPNVILLECTNLGPYKAEIQKRLNAAGFSGEVRDHNDVMAECWKSLQGGFRGDL